MKNLLRCGVAFALCLIGGSAAARADQPPIRQLVYDFQITFTTQETVHSSGFTGDDPDGRSTGDTPSGVADYRMGSNDNGTIRVDVLQVQPDTGLVVRISEQAHGQRSSASLMCVVYGTGSTICDQSRGQLNEEELALLRLLGKNFLNFRQLDARNHWQYSSTGAEAKETSDYTVVGNDGHVASVAYQRLLTVTGSRPFNATTQGTLTYNQILSMPLSVNEETITHRSARLGADDYDRIEKRITLTLAADSLQGAKIQ